MINIKEYVSAEKTALACRMVAKNYKITIAIIQVGDNAASNAYVRGKIKDCAEIGIDTQLIKYPETITQMELMNKVKELNGDPRVNSFIVQLPLPKHINASVITNAIRSEKDLDGFTPTSLVNPATPQGIITYLEVNHFPFDDANAVVIGRSKIVGRPMARLLLDKNCNVSVIHSKTSLKNKRFLTQNADLVIVATGHRNTLIDEDINPHTWVVDVGMNRNDEGKLCGDCENITVTNKTPVPGGVGLLTRLALLANAVKLYEESLK